MTEVGEEYAPASPSSPTKGAVHVPDPAASTRFGIGTFRTTVDSPEFAGLVVGERVLDLSARFPGAAVRDLLDEWDIRDSSRPSTCGRPWHPAKCSRPGRTTAPT